MNEFKTFDLVRNTEIYDDKVNIRYYFNQQNKVRVFSPINVYDDFFGDVVRKRLNLITGEIEEYTRAMCEKIRSCSLSRTWRKISMLLDANHFDWFVTLTFNKDIVDRQNECDVYSVYDKWINKLRRKYPFMCYVCVVERHEPKQWEELGCIHFHLLMGSISAKQLGLVDSGKVCCSWLGDKYSVCNKEYYEKTKEGKLLSDTDGLPVYNIEGFYWGLTTVTRVQSQAKTKSYVKKYLKKDLGCVGAFKNNYFYSRNLKRPEIEKVVVKTSSHYYDLDLYKDVYTPYAINDRYNCDYNVRKLGLDRSIYELLNNGFSPLVVEQKQEETKKNEFNCNNTLIPINIDVSDIF